MGQKKTLSENIDSDSPDVGPGTMVLFFLCRMLFRTGMFARYGAAAASCIRVVV